MYVYAFHRILCIVVFYCVLMHIGSLEGITLLEFEVVEGEDQEAPQQVALEREEQALKELSECPDHRPTSFLKGKPRSIVSLLCFTNINLSSFIFDALSYRSCLETIDAYHFLV